MCAGRSTARGIGELASADPLLGDAAGRRGAAPAPSRRAVLAGAAALIAGTACRAEGLQGGVAESPSLRALSGAKGVAFGAGMDAARVAISPRLGRLMSRDCTITIAMNDMKMEVVETKGGARDFTGADATLRFAQDNGMLLRGTTLVWHRGMPDRVLAEIKPSNAANLMQSWITTIAGRYAGRIDSWDVVNEAIATQHCDDPRSEKLRHTPWLAALGPDYIPLAFNILADVDPKAAGLWNEDDMEPDAKWVEARRTAFLNTLEAQLRRGTPIRRVGLQSHLNSTLPFDDGRFRRFLRRIANLGLAIEITELDVDDRAYPADVAQRDTAVAAFAKRYLDVVLDEPAVLNVLTWGYADGASWYDHSERARGDGLPDRGLPYSEDESPLPMAHAIRDAFAAAPDHRATRAVLRARTSGR